MGTFLVLALVVTLAMLNTLIFLIIFIVRAVTKRNKKQPGIIALLSFVVLITVSVIGGNLYPAEGSQNELYDFNPINTTFAPVDTFVSVNGFKISLGEIKFDDNGFQVIELNAETLNAEFSPTWFSAVLTVKEGKTPIFIEPEIQRRDRYQVLFANYSLRFATNKPPKNLYVELGERGHREGSKWYYFDLESKKCMLLKKGSPFKTLSVFDNSKLINAADSINTDIRAFKPIDPQPMHFIVYANPVINPLTKQVSTGGRTHTDRYLPVSTEDVINDNGYLKETGGLILTDNPNLATFVLILDFTYVERGDRFTYADGSKIKQYSAFNKIELYNLISGESIKTEITTNAAYVGELVSVTHSSKGKQMFAGTIGTRFWDHGGFYDYYVDKGLSAKEFVGYVEFVSKSIN